MQPTKRGSLAAPLSKAHSQTTPKRDPRIARLKGIAREIAIAAGYDVLRLLVQLFGGQRVFIPLGARPPRSGSKLAKLDPATLAKLIEFRGGEYIEVPTGAAIQRQEIIDFLQSSPRPTNNQVASKFGVHRRSVQRMRSTLRAAAP
jgi:hypothetical protein